MSKCDAVYFVGDNQTINRNLSHSIKPICFDAEISLSVTSSKIRI